jgi:CHAT domain-containing protein/predicted negative regulator of RcsB-dependent stress response
LRRGAIAAALLVGARLAAADPGDPAQTAGRAAELCKAGRLEAAAGELRSLLTSLEADLGPGHAAPQIVRLNLSELERRLGNEKAAEEIGRLPPEDPSAGKIDSKLKRALRGLAVCATARSTQTAKPPPRLPALEEVAPEEHLKLARTLVAQGQYRRALDAAKAAQNAAGRSPPPELRMRLHEALAVVRLQLGDQRGALADAAAADEIARSTGAAEVRINVARLVAQAGDLERAGAILRELTASVTSAGSRADHDEARGDLALRLGSPRGALEHLDRALAGHRKVFGADHPYTAAVHHLRGDAYRLAGDFPAATRAYEEALRVRRGALGPKHPETARTQNAIGLLQADLRDWRAADEAFGAALASLTESQGADHPETITIRSNRALARWGATRKGSAVNEYAKVVEDLGVALGRDHPAVAAATRNLSRFEADRGNGQRAEQLLKQALASQMRTLGEGHPELGQTRLQHGRLLAQRGRLDAAAAEVDAAIAIQTQSLGPEHPAVARAHITRARIAAAQRDGATAFREAVEASRAIAVHTRRTFGAISDRQRSLLARDSQDVLGTLLSAPGAPPRDLFISMLPHRDSVLRSIAATRAAARGGHGGEFLRELADLRARYVAAIHGQGPDTAERAKLLARKIEGVERLAAAAGSRMWDLDPNEVLTLACKRLPEDAALVKFTAYERTLPGDASGTVSAYAAIVVRGGSCDVRRVDLGDGDKIEQAAERFAESMREQRTDALNARQSLSDALVAPLLEVTRGARRWLVIPDGSLWGVPVGALPDPQAKDHYLLERVSVGYLTSTHELADASQTESRPDDIERSLLVGAPDFGSSEHGGPVVLTASGPCQVEPFEQLPATRQELEDIRQLIASRRIVAGAEVTKPRLVTELKRKPWLVHFATHAYFAGLGGCHTAQGSDSSGWNGERAPIDANPLLLSGIVLAGANNPTRIDVEGQGGILTAYEVAGMDLGSAGLVVLSACDTGTGLHLRGQEVQGLRWGFRAAGARALVTSLWRSNDAATRKMMRDFYAALVSEDLADDPLRGAEALRRAQLDQVKDEQRLGIRRPLIWANFIFSGVL